MLQNDNDETVVNRVRYNLDQVSRGIATEKRGDGKGKDPKMREISEWDMIG